MTAILVPAGDGAEAVLERLRMWSASRCLSPFVWVDGPGDVTLVIDGDRTRCDLGSALAGRVETAYAVGIALPDAHNAIGDDHVAALRAAQARLEKTATGHNVSAPAMAVFPRDVDTKILVPRPGVLRTLLAVVPEDQSGPRDANHFDAADHERVAAHVAHAVACLTGLFTGSEPQLLAPEPGEIPRLSAEVTLVRCHSRLIDAGFLADALAVKAFTPQESWSSPDPRSYQPDGIETVRGALVKRYIDAHRAIFGLRDVETPAAPPEKRSPLLAALKAIWRFFWAELRQRPWRWLDERLERVWEDKVVRLIDHVGAPAGVKVVHWRERDVERPAGRFMAREIPEIIGSEPGAVAPAWRDLVSLSTCLVDGSEPPFRLDEELQRGKRRLVELRPGRIAPDPLELALIEPPRPRACDPQGYRQRLRELETAAAEDAQRADEGDAETTVEFEDLERLRAWGDERRRSLVWGVGDEIVNAAERAEAESEGPTEEDWQLLDKQLEADEKQERRAGRRRRRWLIVRTLAALAAVVAVSLVDLPTALKPLIGFAIFGLWLILLIHGWWRAQGKSNERRQAAVRRAEALMLQAVVAATRRGDLERLRARYLEFLDWAEVIGHLVHRPWVARREAYSADELILPPDVDTLPAACRLGYALFTQRELLSIAAVGESVAFRPGWLSGLTDQALAGGGADWQRLNPARGRGPEVIDPFTDIPGLRAQVLEHIRSGAGRAVDESGVTQEFFAQIAAEPTRDILAHVVDAASAFDVPLPPAPEWLAAPVELGRLSEETLPLVVGVLASANGGAHSWRGSGVLLPGGFVATCRHCVHGDGVAFAVQTVEDRVLPARVAAVAEDNDVALLRVEGDVETAGAELGLNIELRHGTPLYTVGHPFFAPSSGGPSLSWGIVTAPERVVEGDRGRGEPRIQTNYPAGGGASGSPVFDLHNRLVGIHSGGYSEPGAEQRSAHVSFAVPVRWVQMLLESLGDNHAAERRGVPNVAEEQLKGAVSYHDFVRPLAAKDDCLLGAHGALSTRRRRVVAPHWRSQALTTLTDEQEAGERPRLDETAADRLAIGQPLRVAAVRVDRSETFQVPSSARGVALERLPWFQQRRDTLAEPALEKSVPAAEDGLGSL